MPRLIGAGNATLNRPGLLLSKAALTADRGSLHVDSRCARWADSVRGPPAGGTTSEIFASPMIPGRAAIPPVQHRRRGAGCAIELPPKRQEFNALGDGITTDGGDVSHCQTGYQFVHRFGTPIGAAHGIAFSLARRKSTTARLIEQHRDAIGTPATCLAGSGQLPHLHGRALLSMVRISNQGVLTRQWPG